MIILGIDPGLAVSGFGILKRDGTRAFLLDHGYLKMSSSKPLPERVTMFHDFYTEKILRWQVTDVALETPFLGKNAQNFLKLGYLRGILYLLAHKHGAQLHEFSPREVKASLTGSGAASKEQVARVIQRLFPTIGEFKTADVSDAIAVTMCGLWRVKMDGRLKSM